MPIKKKNIVSLSLSDKAMVCMQVKGFYDGKKNRIGEGNFSAYISELICSDMNAEGRVERAEVHLRVLKKELEDCVKRREFEEERQFNIVEEIRKIKSKLED